MAAQPPQQQGYQQGPGGQPPQKSNPWPWVMGAVAIIVAGVIAALVLTGDNKNKTDSVSTPTPSTLTTSVTTTTTAPPTTITTTTTTTPPPLTTP